MAPFVAVIAVAHPEQVATSLSALSSVGPPREERPFWRSAAVWRPRTHTLLIRSSCGAQSVCGAQGSQKKEDIDSAVSVCVGMKCVSV